MVKRRYAMAVCALLLMGLCGCRQPARTALAIRGGPSLQGLFAELARAYEAQHPAVAIQSNFTCPPCRVMEAGNMPLDFDIFVSFGDFELQKLREHSSFVPASSTAIGSTRLVIATSTRVQTPIKSVADLHRASFRRLGIGNPETVGVGYYAKQALTKMGLWDELQPRMLFSQSGCELLKWLGLGHDVDAAVVFSLCVGDEPGAVQQVMSFPSEVAPPVPMLLAVPQGAPHAAEAQRFIEFARQAQDILRKHRVEPVSVNPTGKQQP